MLQPTEKEITIAVVDYCNANKIPVAHVANERRCSWPQGKILKKMGVISGVSDLLIFHPENKKFALWLELKAGTNRPTTNQKHWLEHVKKYGYHSGWAGSVSAAIKIITDYIG